MAYKPLGRLPGVIFERGTISLSQLRGGVFQGGEFVLSAQTMLRSYGFNTTSEEGWAINGDGSAFFYGDVFFGENAIFLGDIYSSNWNGAIPANLAVQDPNATQGYYFDSSLGVAQLSVVHLGVGVGIYDQTDTNNPRIGAITRTGLVGGAGLLIQGQGDGGMMIETTGANNLLLLRPFTQIGDGSAANPILSFESDPDTGIYRVTTNTIGLSTAGTLRRSISTTEETFTLPQGGPGGSAAAPTYSFSSDTDTGMYRVADNDIGFATDGTLRFRVSTTHLFNPNTGGPALLAGAGSAATPAYGFTNDIDTGFYRHAADRIRVSLGGSDHFQFDTTGFALWAGGTGAAPGIRWALTGNPGIGASNNQIWISPSGAINVLVGTTGLHTGWDGNATGSGLHIWDLFTDIGNHETLRANRGTGTGTTNVGYFSSWEFDQLTGERRKEDIITLSDSPRWNREWFYKIRPVDFRRISTGEREFGFLLDEWKATADDMKYLTTKGDQWGGGPHETAILAAMVIEVQDHEARIRDLEQQVAILTAGKEIHA